ncbi:Protein DCL-like protein chloroplastic [Bienertia sinuspersici]
MAVPPVARGLHLLRLRVRHFLSPHRRPIFSFLFPGSTQSKEDVSSSTTPNTIVKENPNFFDKINKTNHNNTWEHVQDQILLDIDPIVRLVKDILHSPRYMNGARLTPDDEKAVVEKLLAYHPCSEDKIGCGLDSIMVDRHPKYPQQRCLFVVRTDGGWTDFSYQKCLREYVRKQYPSHAEKFEREKLAVRFERQQQRFCLHTTGKL